jgi:hypothetical protein
MGGMGGGIGGIGMMSWNLQQAQAGSLAQLTRKPYTVKVGTAGGQSVSGTLYLSYVQVMSDLGCYAIKPEKVKEVRLSRNPNEPLITGQHGTTVPGVVVTWAGDEIAGRVAVPSWQVETDLGSLMLNPETLKTVAFSREAAEPKAPDGQEKPTKPEPNTSNPGAARPEAKEKGGK